MLQAPSVGRCLELLTCSRCGCASTPPQDLGVPVSVCRALQTETGTHAPQRALEVLRLLWSTSPIPQELGLGDSAVRSFVLEHDPVPRALITADPAFQVLVRHSEGLARAWRMRTLWARRRCGNANATTGPSLRAAQLARNRVDLDLVPEPVLQQLYRLYRMCRMQKRYEPFRQLMDWRGWWVNTSAMGSRLFALIGWMPPEAHKPLQSPVVSAHRFVFGEWCLRCEGGRGAAAERTAFVFGEALSSGAREGRRPPLRPAGVSASTRGSAPQEGAREPPCALPLRCALQRTWAASTSSKVRSEAPSACAVCSPLRRCPARRWPPA